MTKYLASAAIAALIGAASFIAPASAQGVSISVGGGGHHNGYYAPRHHGYYNGGRPGVRVYSGRSSYRQAPACETRKTTKWVNGKKIVRTVRVCD